MDGILNRFVGEIYTGYKIFFDFLTPEEKFDSLIFKTFNMKNLIFITVIIFFFSCNSKKEIPTTESNPIGIQVTTQDSKETLELKEQEDLTSKGFDLMNNESLGKIKFGVTSEEIIELLGEPEEKSTPFFSEVDGETYQHFDYKKEGIFLSFILNSDSSKEVRLIEIMPPCELKTSRLVGIGSFSTEVLVSYKEFINEEFSDTTEIVAGSIYGGIIFKIENQKVKSIYIGPTAD